MGWTVSDQYQTAVVFAGTFALSFVLWHQFSKRNRAGGKLPPSIGTLPFVGSLPYLPKTNELHKKFLEKSYKMGDVISFQLFNMYIVVLNSYDSIREGLVKQSADTSDRPYIYVNEYLNPQYKGIIDAYYNTSFKKYHQLSISILKEFGFGHAVMETRISEEVDELIHLLKKQEGQPVYPKESVASSVLSVISSIAIGDRLRDPTINKRLAKAVDAIFANSEEMFQADLIKIYRIMPSFKEKLHKVIEAQQVIMDIIDERIAKYRSPGAALDESFISSFISREGEEFDVDQLRFILRDFLLAGFETSSTTIIWIILTLANHPDIQERLHKQLDSVVPRDRLPSLEDKSKMPYLEATMLEVMRYFTLVPTGLPHTVINDTIIAGYTVPKGTQLITNIYAAHNDKRFWEEPEEFKPERFLDSSGTKVINKDRVISFSLGKRSCLGELLARQEIYLFMTGLVQQFYIRPPEGQDKITFDEILHITVQPSTFHVRFIPRQ